MRNYILAALLTCITFSSAEARPLICPDSIVSGCQVLRTPDDRPNGRCQVSDKDHCRIPFPPTVENGKKVCRFECQRFLRQL